MKTRAIAPATRRSTETVVKRLAALSPVAFFLIASSVGCILLVSPDERGTQCRFRGEDTACGSCLASRCRTEIDRACFDEAVISPTEQCAAAADEACNRLPASALSTCLQAQCNALCYARVGKSQTRCTESFVAPGLACSCEFGTSVTTDLGCNPEVYPRTRCCAPPAWPGPALECRCDAISCQPSSDGCICILSDNLDSATAVECKKAPGGHCCVARDRCQCRTRECGSETEVEVCNKQEVACPSNTVEVDGCSIRQ